MFFIVYTFSLKLILIKSPLVDDSIPLRKDCYASFTVPVVYIIISHYNPTGPLFLSVKFYYKRYSALLGHKPQFLSTEYDFKRFDSPCRCSVLLTTLGQDFQKFDIFILIYLSKKESEMAHIQYTFYKDFIPGVYELLDNYQNFAIELQVLDSTQKHIVDRLRLAYEADSYISSISGNMQELCIITENNRAIVLNPKYEANTSYGFIYGFQAIIRRNGIIVGIRGYPAFDCHKDEKYPYEPIIFITDGIDYKISFRVLYWSKYTSYLKEITSSFEFSHPKFDYIHNLEKIPKEHKKVFLMRLYIGFIKCDDKSQPTVYLSEKRKIYIAKIAKKVNFSTAVEFHGQFYRSVLDPCVE